MLVAPHNERPPCFCSVAPAGSKRKYQHTLEMIYAQNSWVGVHSALANKMAEVSLRAGLIDGCCGFSELRREVPVKLGRDDLSKIDFELSFGEKKMLLEVKSVTLNTGNASAEFPDAKSERGQKHLRCLTDYVRKGGTAGILFLVQRDDCATFSACDMDPLYGPALHEAAAAGVLILPYHCRLDPEAGTVSLQGRIPFVDTYADGRNAPTKQAKQEEGASTKKRKRA